MSASRDGGAPQLNAWTVATGDVRAVTDDEFGVLFGWIDPPGDYLYFLRDTAGNELGHVARVPYDGGPVEDLTPNIEPYTLRGIGFSADGRAVAVNAVNQDGYCVYVIDGAGDPFRARLIHRDSWETWGALLSADGDLVACWSTARSGGVRKHTLLAFDTATGGVVGELDDGRAAGVTGVAFSPILGDRRLLARSTRTGFVRPVVWDPRTGDRDDLVLATASGDVVPVTWSPDGRAVLLCEAGGTQRLHRYDLATGTDRALDHPAGTYVDEIFGGPSFATTDTIVGLRASAVTPCDVLELDARDGHPRRVVIEPAEAPAAYPWRSVVFRSADGTPIQAFVATPPGDGPFPTIVEMHGGPHIMLNEFYYASAAGWIDRGYAWISPNFRGSTGFGQAFMEQIWGAMGARELEDIAAAREFAVREGIAVPDEMFVHGGSYGGYLTLLAVGRQPSLWAGGIAVAATGDIVSEFNECSDALRGAYIAWMRGTPTERPESYAASSPITYAAQVNAPVFVAQFENDTNTPAGQLRNYERRLRELGKSIDVHWMDGGHASFVPEAEALMYERMYAFADGVLDRRRSERSGDQ